MKKALLIIALCLPLLHGCVTFGPKVPDATIPTKVVKLDPKALESCAKALPKLDIAPGDDPYYAILQNVDVITRMYATCADKQDNSIELLKQFSNTQETK